MHLFIANSFVASTLEFVVNQVILESVLLESSNKKMKIGMVQISEKEMDNGIILIMMVMG